MANKTANFGLTKPEATDFYDVNVQNGNMDIIDEKLMERYDEARTLRHEVEVWEQDAEKKFNDLQKQVDYLMTSGTDDLVAGESQLVTGMLYLVYE